MILNNMITWQAGVFFIDVLIVSYLIYLLISFSKNTRILDVLKGVLVVLGLKIISDFLSLQALSWMIDQIITWGVIAVIIIFQPEIRRSLEQLGRNKLFRKKRQSSMASTTQVIDHLIEAIQYLSKRSIGALVSIEINMPLDRYAHSGVRLNALLSSQLLINLFIPNTPLHDGAVIIKGNKIIAASSVLPLSEKHDIPQELGTRHRAAIGLSEQADAVTIIVSEETGHISLTHNEQLYRDLTIEQFQSILKSHLLDDSSQHMNHKVTVYQDIIEWFKGGKRNE